MKRLSTWAFLIKLKIQKFTQKIFQIIIHTVIILISELIFA